MSFSVRLKNLNNDIKCEQSKKIADFIKKAKFASYAKKAKIRGPEILKNIPLH